MFCDRGGSSLGVRSLLESQALDELLKISPQLKFEAVVSSGRHPYLETEYVNGWSRTIGLKNLSSEEVLAAITRARNQIGAKAKKHSGPKVVSSTPSIQGRWKANMWRTAHVFEDSSHMALPEPPNKGALVPVKPKRVENPAKFAAYVMRKNVLN
jgi:hypothetical protein